MTMAPSTSGDSSALHQFRVAEACESGKQFAQIFYEKLDKGRHHFYKLFHENATLVWNGRATVGRESICEFYEKLPSSESSVTCVDSQPAPELAELNGQKLLCITVYGRCVFRGSPRACVFTEVFTLVAEPGSEKNVWKVVSDTYRTVSS